MINKKEYLAAVVTYNRKDLLGKCLEPLIKNNEINVVVVDNHSDDGTVNFLRKIEEKYKKVKVLYQEKNIGGAGGFNIALKYAYENGYSYCWLMDDDTIVSQESFNNLKKAKEILDDNFGFLCSTVLYKDGNECKMNRFKIYKKFYIESPLLKYGLIRVTQATFVSFFINVKIIKEIGYPIKEYFIWGDDMEYSLRISKKYPCYAVGNSQVYHYTKSNVGSSIAIDENRLERYELAFRNDFATAKKNGFNGILYYFGKCGINFIRILILSPNRKLKRVVILFKGFFKGLFFNPKIEYVD